MKTYYKKLLSVVTIVAVLINVVGCSTSTQPSDENKGNANNEIVETPKDDDFEQKPQDEDNDKEDEKDKTEDKGKVDEAVSNDKDKENKPTQPSKDEEKPSKPANIPNDNGNNGTKPTQPEPTPDPKPEEPTNPQPNPKPEEPSKPEQPHEHNFMKTVIEPDCDNEGYTKYECKCGYSYQDNKTAALGDDWGEWVVMKEPTVDELGEKRRECKRCGASQRRTIDKLHSHKWETGWLDSEIATDRNGKKIGINMCAKCFAYFGSPDNDEWVVRYWDHCDNVHDTGYSSYPVYAYYDIEWCPGCDGKNRLGFAYYAYLDYSVSNKVGTIILEPWQVEELNLPLR